jgi:hypothetical protein
MSSAQNSSGSAGKVGRPFPKGVSGNPGGRPKSLGKSTRKVVGEDGMALVELWWSIAQDPMQRTSDRLVASRLLADRGWGKPASFEPLEGDPFDLADAEKAAEEFRAKIMRLVETRTGHRPSNPSRWGRAVRRLPTHFLAKALRSAWAMTALAQSTRNS